MVVVLNFNENNMKVEVQGFINFPAPLAKEILAPTIF